MIAIGLARNNPFVDGNRRTAYVALEYFLIANGFALTATDAESVVGMLALAAGELSDNEFVDWVKLHSAGRP